MDLFFAEHFGASPALVRDFVGDDSFESVLDYLVDTKTPPFGLSMYAFQRIIPACKKERIKLRLHTWATKHNRLSMLKEMSLLELEIVLEINPYYVMYAFNMPFDACLELVQMLDLHLGPNMAAHALLWNLLQTTPKMVVEDAHAVLEKRGCKVTEQLDRIDVFPSCLLNEHPLRHIDPDVESASVMKEKIPDCRAIVSCIRERKFLTNRVLMVRGKYMLRNKAFRFVMELDRVFKNAQRLKPTIKKEYKRLRGD